MAHLYQTVGLYFKFRDLNSEPNEVQREKKCIHVIECANIFVGIQAADGQRPNF